MIQTIIPIHNISQHRDLDRIYFQIYSLINQTDYLPNITISTSSEETELTKIQSIVDKFKSYKGEITLIHTPAEKMNFPRLINQAVSQSKEPFIHVTGADFIYRYDFTTTIIEKLNRKNIFGVCLVKMMHNTEYMYLDTDKIDAWKFKGHDYNKGGDYANGICIMNRWLWDKIGGMNEYMSGYSGFDNDLVNRARNALGRMIYLHKSTECIHLNHPAQKGRKPTQDQMRNWSIMDYNKRRTVVNWKDGARK